jgi:O-antigen ligase
MPGSLFGDLVNTGLTYEAAKNSNSFGDFVKLRLWYGLLFLGFLAIPIAIVFIVLYATKQTPAQQHMLQREGFGDVNPRKDRLRMEKTR